MVFLYIFANNLLNPLQCATADPDGRQRALVIGGGIANFTDVAATFNGIIRALKEKVSSFFWLFLYFRVMRLAKAIITEFVFSRNRSQS